jgi:hypothetical protein
MTRLGISVEAESIRTVLVLEDGTVLSHADVPDIDPARSMRDAIEKTIAGYDTRAIDYAILCDQTSQRDIHSAYRLARAGILRLSGPIGSSIPPGTSWPVDLHRTVIGPYTSISGGHEYNGEAPAPLDESAAIDFLHECDRQNVTSIAVSSPFAPVWPAHELRIEELAQERFGSKLRVTLSHRIGSLNFIERENAAIINASIVAGGHTAIDRFLEAIERCGITAAPYVAQSDGSLSTAQEALAHPLRSFGSARATGIHGARILSGMTAGLVIDVAEERTRIGTLERGYPRLARTSVSPGGVATNLRVVESFELPFGRRDFIAQGRGRSRFDSGTASDTANSMTARLGTSVKRLWRSSKPAEAIIIGTGGPPIFPDDVPALSRITQLDHEFSIAAFGAALAEATGAADRIFFHDPDNDRAHLDEAVRQAIESAHRAGASPEHTRVISVTESPLIYLPLPASRVIARAAGPLRH